ncbi:hypothetical protein [Actinoallomurus rhizosphaericola]|uniref:hypothetical protein n=1 Tax=Actinoallomurus rhizosphaericola TaxID=2952536 RepID=UPI002092A007|nr:hypothetical protein [Actinoallomurus rhizosphaericola]MCO5998806.1 hypothetical protein [Actinoallomurus rhizosphaericola]
MIADLVDRILSGDDDAAWELEELVEHDPDALRPYLSRLLDADDVYLPEALFREADEDVQREAVARIDAGSPNVWLVTMLTATYGPVAEAAFRRWLKQAPPGIEAETLANVLPRYGWDFEADGQARKIRGATAYELVPEDGAASAEEECPWCGGPLWVVLDVDTTDPRVAAALAHTGWRGRLRIVACFLCCIYPGVSFAEVTPDGGATWSAHTVRPGYLDGKKLEKADPPPVRLTVGERRPDRYLGGPTLGGEPDWVQDPDYPACPACRKVMNYVGGMTGTVIRDYIDCDFFLFLHAPCGLAAVVTQTD